jgi:phage gp45-like
MVRIANRTTSWARKNNFESGESTIFATSGAEINDDTGELIIPSGSTIEVSYAWFLSFPTECITMAIETRRSNHSNWHTAAFDLRLVVEMADTATTVTTVIAKRPR